MNRKEMRMLLEERFERITLLETRIDTMEQLVEGYREREQSIIDTLRAAKENAARMVGEARAQAEEIRSKAIKESQAMREEAKAAADTFAVQAQAQAVELRASAKAESDRVLRDAEIAKREYEELVASFNAMLAQNASELEQSAARFAEFVKERKIDPPEIRLDGGAFYKSVGEMGGSDLPDPGDDPASLMKNIYRLQNRPLPGAEESAPEAGKPAPAAPEAPEAAHPPFSERAWADEKRESRSEPQAEFAPAFENGFTPSSFELQPDGCAVPVPEEAERAFDEYFPAQPQDKRAQDDAKAAPEPYSEAAWAHDAMPSGHEPQAEGTAAFDEYFSQAAQPKTAQPQDKRAQDDAKPEPEPYSKAAWAHDAFTGASEPQAEGAAAFDAMFGGDAAESGEKAKPAVSYEGVGLDETPQPEPYSKAAWAHDAFTGASEPQAEGAAAFDAMFGGDAAESGEKAKPSAFDEAADRFVSDDEPREWEPEREPEMGDVPTVSQFVPENGEHEGVTLDQLLEEIIKAGE
ncbi:MAG: hypothetical protein VB034_01510 [Eubacteriales bacterium]|nr:hypothetical protein [Eubacteriales bacterium]